MIAAFLYAQLEEVIAITLTRLSLWNYYHKLLEPLEQASKLRRPTIPAHCQHNAHMYYILVENLDTRSAMIEYLKQQGINSVFHYVPFTVHQQVYSLEKFTVQWKIPIMCQIVS